MELESWDDIRIALAVARAGTVSGAAQALGVHHATVIRRIDALEAQLGARLFQRHARGYTPTEAGRVLLDTVHALPARLSQMAQRISGTTERIEGDLLIAALPDLADMFAPRLIALLHAHPALRLHYLTDSRLARLDAGEAHVAIRAGAQPQEPDYVVQPLGPLMMPLYASAGYIARHGMPGVAADGAPDAGFGNHRFVLHGSDARRAPFMQWLGDRLRPDRIVMVSNDGAMRMAAIRAGLGVGWALPEQTEGLVEVLRLPQWQSDIWLVSHVDLHRTPKVQAAIAALRGFGQGLSPQCAAAQTDRQDAPFAKDKPHDR